MKLFFLGMYQMHYEQRLSFTPPLISDFIKRKYWAIHEAAFVLTGWPKEVSCNLYGFPPPWMIRKYESNFYLPSDYAVFDPHQYGKQFKNIFFEMEREIEQETLCATSVNLYQGIKWVVEPTHAIVWALFNGYLFPEDLQKEIGIYLIDQKMGKPYRNLVERKIIAQFLLMEKNRNLGH